MNEKIIVNGYYFNAEGQILLSCATDSVNSICVKKPRWDKEKWSPVPRGPTSACCPPHPCSAKPLQSCSWFTWPKDGGGGGRPTELLAEPINGKTQALIDFSDPGDGLAEGKVGRVVCAATLIAVSEEVAVRILCARGTLITFHPTFFRLISILRGLCRLQCAH